MFFLSELNWADSQANRVLSDFGCLGNATQLTIELGQIACSAQRTPSHRFATVDRDVRSSADVKWIVLVILELISIGWGSLTSRQDFACLLSHFRAWSDL